MADAIPYGAGPGGQILEKLYKNPKGKELVDKAMAGELEHEEPAPISLADSAKAYIKGLYENVIKGPYEAIVNSVVKPAASALEKTAEKEAPKGPQTAPAH